MKDKHSSLFDCSSGSVLSNLVALPGQFPILVGRQIWSQVGSLPGWFCQIWLLFWVGFPSWSVDKTDLEEQPNLNQPGSLPGRFVKFGHSSGSVLSTDQDVEQRPTLTKLIWNSSRSFCQIWSLFWVGFGRSSRLVPHPGRLTKLTWKSDQILTKQPGRVPGQFSQV